MSVLSPEQPTAFQLLPGRGVAATVGECEIFAGNELLVADHGLTMPGELMERANIAKEEGSTIIYVMEKERVIGFIALTDTLRPDAAQTVKDITATGTKMVLLTRDTPQAANHIASASGISDVRADCLPEDKLNAIRKYQENGEPICMVGDGILDWAMPIP